MMDIIEYQDAYNSSQEVEMQKTSSTILGPTWGTTWGVGTRPDAGTYPASGAETVDYSHPSALKFPQPGPGKRITIIKATLRCSSAAGVALFDRLVHTAPQELIGTGTISIDTGSLPPRASGWDDIEAWIEFTEATTNYASAFIQVEYTNSDGLSGRMSPDILLNNVVRLNNGIKVPLMAGDRGVQSIDAINVSSTWTTGKVSAVLAKRICTLEYFNTLSLNTYGLLSLQNPYIHKDACIFGMRGSGGSSAPSMNLTMQFTEIDEND